MKDKVDKMEQSVQFRITAARDNEVMDRLYSRARGKILFALPPKVKIVSTASVLYCHSPLISLTMFYSVLDKNQLIRVSIRRLEFQLVQLIYLMQSLNTSKP